MDEQLRAALQAHFIVQIECSHPVDRAHCICGWISSWAKNVGEAGKLWVAHVEALLASEKPPAAEPWLFGIESVTGKWKDGEQCVFGDRSSAQEEVDLLNDEFEEGKEEYNVVPLYRVLPACALADRVRELSPAQAEVEYFRKTLMEHFHDKLSMDEIADCAYAMSERTGTKSRRPASQGASQVSKFRKKPVIVEGRLVTQSETVLTAHGRVRAEPGDWILQDPRTGDTWPIKPDIFAETYEPVRDDGAKEPAK